VLLEFLLDIQKIPLKCDSLVYISLLCRHVYQTYYTDIFKVLLNSNEYTCVGGSVIKPECSHLILLQAQRWRKDMQLALTDRKLFKIGVSEVEGRGNLDRLNIGGNIILKLKMKYCIKCGVDLSGPFYGLLADYTGCV
jgi:hypothetical protein